MRQRGVVQQTAKQQLRGQKQQHSAHRAAMAVAESQGRKVGGSQSPQQVPTSTARATGGAAAVLQQAARHQPAARTQLQHQQQGRQLQRPRAQVGGAGAAAAKGTDVTEVIATTQGALAEITGCMAWLRGLVAWRGCTHRPRGPWKPNYSAL